MTIGDATVAQNGDRAQTIALSLIAHTNAGKTTLARTLLGRDVGDVRDAPHVTGSAERYTMIESGGGDILELWDTPGFGDSARLARRLAGVEHPIARFLAMTWDRWRDRASWSSQQAVQNVRDEADVVLYLVNASESPTDAGYIEPELQILEWIGKPVVALLNQTGRPRSPDD
jgi:predicted GTPase